MVEWQGPNTWRKTQKQIALALVLLMFFLLSSFFVSAIGVVPSSYDITYEAGKSISYQLKIVNNDKQSKQVFIYAEGELSSNIGFDKSILDFTAGEESKIITVTVSQPTSVSKQGKIESKIVVREIPSGGGQISASTSVVSKLTLVVPYDKSYAEAKLFVGNFESGKQNNFVVEVTNLGSQDITSSRSMLSVIKARTGEELVTLLSEEARIPKSSKRLFTISWTPSVPNGVYEVKALTIYDGKSVEDTKTFSIGSQSISIQGINVQNFNLGGIAKFDVLLKNDWGEKINDVYAEIQVFDGNNLFASSTTQTVSLEALQTQQVNAYWDTNKVIPGKYDLKISIFYNGKVSERTFPIIVKQDSIDTGFTGNVIGGSSSSGKNSDGSGNGVYLLALLIIVVLVTNVILFKKLLNKK